MVIKSYQTFLESKNYRYGCVMVYLDIPNWEEITSIIDKKDLYKPEDRKYGIEGNPHVTILYGLHSDVKDEDVIQIFENFDGDIDIEVNGVDIFENDKFDVVKFNVNPQSSLQYLFDELSKLPNSNQFPDYKPHITLCYTKKGTGKKYVKDDYRYTVRNVNKICYSLSNGKKFYFEI
jgi:2'-5' RNA ligase